MNTVCVIPVSLDKDPYVETIDGSLKAMQNLVGGYIERVQTPLVDVHSNLTYGMYVNEEGRLDGLPRNLRAEAFYPGIIAGQVFLQLETKSLEDYYVHDLPQNFDLDDLTLYARGIIAGSVPPVSFRVGS